MSVTEQSQRISLFVPTMNGAGTERAIMLLANYWVEHGRPVDLVLCVEEGALLEQLHSEVCVYSLSSRNPLIQLFRLIRYMRLGRSAVFMSALNPANVLSVLAKCFVQNPARVIACVQNHLGAKYACQPSILNPLRRFVIGWALKKASRVVAVSEAIKDHLSSELKIPAERIEVIYNPVDVGLIQRKSNEPVIHDWLNGFSGSLLIAAGRLNQQKRFDRLIEVMSLLPNECRLVILGEGELRSDLEKRIHAKNLSDRILMPGFQENPYVWFSRADCYAMSSDWEGFPFVLLEAMAAGIPIVSTDCLSGPRELLDNEKYGRLVPIWDASVFSDAVRAMLENPIPKSVNQERAAHFSIDRIAQDYLACYRIL